MGEVLGMSCDSAAGDLDAAHVHPVATDAERTFVGSGYDSTAIRNRSYLRESLWNPRRVNGADMPDHDIGEGGVADRLASWRSPLAFADVIDGRSDVEPTMGSCA